MVSIQTEAPVGGSKAAAISNYVVRTMSAYTGRGPTKARTYLNDDLVTVVLQDTLTKGERSLVSDDLDDLVLAMRKPFQGTMRRDLMPVSRRSSSQGDRVHERQPRRPGPRRRGVPARALRAAERRARVTGQGKSEATEPIASADSLRVGTGGLESARLPTGWAIHP